MGGPTIEMFGKLGRGHVRSMGGVSGLVKSLPVGIPTLLPDEVNTIHARTSLLRAARSHGIVLDTLIHEGKLWALRREDGYVKSSIFELKP